MHAKQKAKSYLHALQLTMFKCVLSLMDYLLGLKHLPAQQITQGAPWMEVPFKSTWRRQCASTRGTERGQRGALTACRELPHTMALQYVRCGA